MIAVAKGLYIGTQEALEQAAAAGITHALSVVNYDVQPPDGLCHWSISVEDSQSSDLLHQLPLAVTWLERAMRQAGSKVLVHCNAGTSRSPAVVVAAIMKAKGLSAQDALRVLQSRAPQASPNPGFMAQLELWAEMGCDINEDHPGYKQFMLSQTAQQWEEQGYVDPESMAVLPEDEDTLAKLVRYRCRKCRQIIATERNVIPQEGVGCRSFRRQQHQHQQPSPALPDPSFGGNNAEQGAVFLEPISWMADQIVGPVQGKLYCPNCSARMGSFNWAGITTSSGAWMIPGFQLHLSKLDMVSPKPPAALAGMRFPAMLADHKQQQPPQGQEQQQLGTDQTEVVANQGQQGTTDFLPDIMGDLAIDS